MVETAPGTGERRATRGLVAQHRVAAVLVYDALLDGDLEWIRLADPEAGRVDDIQIARPGRLDAYQVKWARYEERITLDRLTKRAADAPSAIVQLADGWSRLKDLHPDRVVHVHLLARSSASTDGGPHHLQAFLREAFPERARWSSPEGTDVARDWAAYIDKLRASSGLDEEAFAAFIARCHFDFGFRLEAPAGTRSDARRADDLRALAQHLLELVAEDRDVVEVSRARLLGGLGWDGLLAFRFRHDFPVDEHLYRPVRATVERLCGAFGTLTRGYVALVGPPGSGKSTTLTQVLRYRAGFRIVRYYAFVRDDTRQGRGESDAFLHDVCLALRSTVANAVPGRRFGPVPRSRDELLEAFGALLGALHDDWRVSGVVTLVLVDGLDHVEREQRPVRALLDDLPPPDTILDGVLFVLGTQSLGLESASLRAIRAHLGREGRTIDMAPLDPGAVREITVAAAPAATLSEAEHECIRRICAGHPLSLRYLLARIADAAPETVASIFAETEPLGGDVERQYGVYWEALKDDPGVVDLLAAVCRLRGAVDLDVLSDLGERAALERFVASARHFFRAETRRRWTFFHDSFRQFLVRVTALNAFGEGDPAIDAGHHCRLAQAAGQADPASPFAWDLFHHLDAAGDPTAILAAFTQARPRAQFLAGRPPDEVLADIRLCVDAAALAEDAVAVVRAILIEKEMTDRASAFDEIDLSELLLALAAPGDRPSVAMRGGELRVPPAVALAFAVRLAEGDHALARRLFDAAEPWDLLAGATPLEDRGQRDHIEAWVRAAWRFRPVAEVIAAMVQIRYAADEVSPDAAVAPWIGLSGVLAQDLVAHGPADGLEVLEDHLARDGGAAGREVRLALECHRSRSALARDDTATARAAMDRVFDMYGPAHVERGVAAALAELGFRSGQDRDRVRAYVERVGAPLLFDGVPDGEHAIAVAHPLLLQARVLAALGSPLDPSVAVPAARGRLRGIVLLSHAVISVGTLLGDADAKRRWSAPEVVRRLRPTIGMFLQTYAETREWSDWYRIEACAHDLFDLALEAAHAHGVEALGAAFDAFAEDWGAERRPPSSYLKAAPEWRTAWKRSVVMAAHRRDPDVARTSEWLDRLEREVDVCSERDTRLGLLHEIASSWLLVGDERRARALLDAMMAASFAVYDQEDAQFAAWAEWCARFATQAPDSETAADALDGLLRALPILHVERRGASRDEVAVAVVRTAAARRPGWGSAVALWLLEQEGSSWAPVVTGLIEGCLRLVPPDPNAVVCCLAVASRMLVPVQVLCDDGLAERLAGAVAACRAAPTVRAAFDDLLAAIATAAFAKERAAWASAMARGLRAAGEDPVDWGVDPAVAEDDEPPLDPGPAPGVVLASGSFLAQPAVLDLAADPLRLGATMRDAREVRNLDWTAVLTAVLPAVTTAATLRALRADLLCADLPMYADAMLARHAVAIGDSEEAGRAVERVVEQSSPQGWYRNWDGGSRPMAARCLVEILGPRAGRRRSFRLFVDDYRQQRLRPRQLLLDLDAVVEALFETPPVDALWREISEHVSQLAEVREGASASRPSSDGSDDAATAIVGFVLAQRGHPVAWLAEATSKTLRLLWERSACATLPATIAALLASSLETDQETALTVLLGLPADAAAGAMSADVVRLQASPSAIIRRLAEQAGTRCGLDRAARPTLPLPAIYTVDAVRSPFAPAEPRPSPSAPVVDTDDPVELSRQFLPVLVDMADAAGIDAWNLAYRMGRLMESLASPSTWNGAAEQRLQDHLARIGLSYPYVRPRSAIAFRAFARVASELCDAGRLSWSFAPLAPYLAPFDPVLSGVDPVARPPWANLPPSRRTGADLWREDVGAAVAATGRTTPEGWLVLGESARFARHDSGRGVERRASVIAHPSWAPRSLDEPEYGFVPVDPRLTGEGYHDADGSRRQVVVVKGGSLHTSPFLALDPRLGRDLGWVPCPRTLFGWKDGAGRPTAWTIWWRDGNPDYVEPLAPGSVSGEGWLVVATRDGAADIRTFLGQARRSILCSRSSSEESRGEETVCLHAVEEF